MPESRTTTRSTPTRRQRKEKTEPDGGRGSALALPASTSLTRIRQSAEVIDQRGKGVILVVDPDAERSATTADALESVGYRCDIASRAEAALETIQNNYYDVVVADVSVEGMEWLEFLRRVRELNVWVAIVVLASHRAIGDAVQSAVDAMKVGASDYLARPIDFELLISRVQRAIESSRLVRMSQDRGRLMTAAPKGFEGIIFQSEKMRRVVERCARVAETDATILITGESGTGKDLLARAIHEASPRRNRRFMPADCAAFSPQLIESELFGHEKGAFTGAISSRPGRFEHADGGTIFLDEVGDMPLEAQVKLLRVLENRQVFRVGANDPIPVDVRVISATHRNLEEFLREGKFREDLYYRLNVITVHVPPLRERPQDIPPLIDYFLERHAEGKRFETIEPQALAALLTHEWKGNVRELRHAIESISVLAPGPVITVRDLPESIRKMRQIEAGKSVAVEGLVGVTIQEMERELIRSTLAHVDGNRQEAAKMLGIAERTLYRRIRDYGLS